MGAWGRGLLQNDDSQDGLCEIISLVEAEVHRLARRKPSEAMAGRLSGAIGLLLQLQAWYCFDPKEDFYQTLQKVLTRHEPMFTALPARAQRLLRDVMADKGLDLAYRNGPLDRALKKAFFEEPGEFKTQRTFGKREPALFEHPAAAALVQEFVSRCLRLVNRGFRKRSIASDLWREGGTTIAALCVLLVVEPCSVNPALFREWQQLFRAATAGQDEAEDEGEDAYRRHVESALEYGLKRFTAEPQPEE